MWINHVIFLGKHCHLQTGYEEELGSNTRGPEWERWDYRNLEILLITIVFQFLYSIDHSEVFISAFHNFFQRRYSVNGETMITSHPTSPVGPPISISSYTWAEKSKSWSWRRNMHM
jgi:hypothetical protein